MRQLTCPYSISIFLQFLLIFTRSALIINPQECFQVQAAPVDGPSDQRLYQHHLDKRRYAFSNNFISDPAGSTTDLPVIDGVTPEPTLVLSNTPAALSQIDGRPVQRLQHVVHETNKVILLTNGEQIKLYPIKESDLTPSGGYYVIKSKLNYTASGWKRPLISDVSYVFDNRFCTSSNHPWILKSNCLVIFWLDKRNKFLRYGSFMFTNSSRIELLSSKFNAYGNLKSLSDKNMKTIWLDERSPIDLCRRANELDHHLVDCELSSMTIDRSNQELRVYLNVSATAGIAHQQINTCVNVIMSTYIGKTLFNFQTVDISPSGNTDIKIPHASAMTVDEFGCKLYWLNTNYELYTSNLAGQDVQLIEKLSSRPAIRTLGEIHSYRDILFFSDIATKSIMSYNITQRAEIIRQNKPQEEKRKKKFDMVQRLESTHQVLLVETSAINKFNIIDLKEDPWKTGRTCKMKQSRSYEEPRVIDDDLTDHLRKEKLVSYHERYFLGEIMQLTLIVLPILLIIFIVAEKTRVKKMKPDRETFVGHEAL